MSELRGLQLNLDGIRAAGAELMAICVDTPDQNRGVVQSHGLDFPILSDAKREAIRAFGLLHEGGAPDGSDIARPAIYLIENGEVVWRELTDNWRVRIRPEALVEVVRERWS